MNDYLEQTESVKIDSLLHTDLYLARRGKDALGKTIANLIRFDSALATKVTNNPLVYKDITSVFLGTNPEVSMEHLRKNEMEEVAAAINSLGDERYGVIANHVDPEIEKHHPYSFINFEAAKRVARANPDLFPQESLEDIREWLYINKALWLNVIKDKDAERRYGLLSGFPRNAVNKFIPFFAAREKIRAIISEYKGEDFQLLNDYVWTTIDFRSEVDKSRLTEILERSGVVNHNEINLLTTRFSVKTPAAPFWGFDETDRTWGNQLSIIYNTVMKKED